MNDSPERKTLSERIEAAHPAPSWIQSPLELCDSVDALLRIAESKQPLTEKRSAALQKVRTASDDLKRYATIYDSDPRTRTDDPQKSFGVRRVLTAKKRLLLKLAMQTLITHSEQN